MNLFGKEDLNGFFGMVIRNVARELEVTDWEWLFYLELLEEIRRIDSRVADKLDEFFSAYTKWYFFIIKVRNDGKAGNLSNSDKNEMNILIDARNNARSDLLKALRPQPQWDAPPRCG